MRSKATSQDIIDLSDVVGLSTDEIDERHEEISRIDRKLDALRMRKHMLECELGLERATELEVDIEGIEARLFLDDSIDVFETTSSVRKDDAADFDINDSEFDERFAAFASSDAEGDHAARRWLSR